MNANDLHGKSSDELRVIAKNLGIKPHPRAKTDTLMQQILQQPQAYQDKAMQHKAEAAVKPIYHNTPEEVLQAIKEFVSKEGYVAEFPDDGTWVFKYKGAEESGNLSIPLRVIKMKAESVARGRRILRSMGNDGSYKGYADNILMG